MIAMKVYVIAAMMKIIMIVMKVYVIAAMRKMADNVMRLHVIAAMRKVTYSAMKHYGVANLLQAKVLKLLFSIRVQMMLRQQGVFHLLKTKKY